MKHSIFLLQKHFVQFECLYRGCEVIEVDCSSTLLEKVQAFDSNLVKLLAHLTCAAAIILSTTMVVAYLDLIDEILL